MALPRTNRLRYTLLRSRRTPLTDCLDSRPLERKRRYFKNFAAGFFFIIILHFSYAYIWLPEEISTNKVVIDEYLSTQSPPIGEDDPDNSFKTERSLFQYTINFTTSTTAAPKIEQMLPRCIRSAQFGRIDLNLSKISLPDLEYVYPNVKYGGYYYPSNCSTKQMIAILVPYRDREANLATFLYNIHPILMAQQLEYQIFVIEQAGNDLFNKGRLYNAGFKEVVKLKKYRCIVFHNLDYLPKFFEIKYTCPSLPRHMSSFSGLESSRDPIKSKSLFGGVVSLTNEMFFRVNGYSNVYFGSGGEDNDMFLRLRSAGYPIVKYSKSVGVFVILPHNKASVNRFRQFLLARATERYRKDGLSNLKYVVLSTKSYHLYTHILVDINPGKQNVTALMLKWASGDNTF